MVDTNLAYWNSYDLTPISNSMDMTDQLAYEVNHLVQSRKYPPAVLRSSLRLLLQSLAQNYYSETLFSFIAQFVVSNKTSTLFHYH